MSLSLPGLALMGGGLVLVYSGIEDPDGGPVGVLRSILTGKVPTPGKQITTIGASGLSLGTVGGNASAVGPSTGVGGAGAAAVIGANTSATRAKIIATAQSYLGVPYRFGQASRSGVDCSGLVLLAYRSVGIELFHKASVQASPRYARQISRSEIKPGDLVAWGAPGNYPHIALAMNADQVIVAPHTGTVVKYQKLWEKKVSGYGYPDIWRVLKD